MYAGAFLCSNPIDRQILILLYFIGHTPISLPAFNHKSVSTEYRVLTNQSNYNLTTINFVCHRPKIILWISFKSQIYRNFRRVRSNFGGKLTMNTTTSGYKLLELIALSGEASPDILTRLGISTSYQEKLITRLKEEHLIKTHYKDKLRGYRLTSTGKKLLLNESPDRFSFYLTGSSDTNQPRSDITRRLRLHQASKVYVLLQNAGVTFFRDKKPLLFCNSPPVNPVPLPFPVFYHSREIKELGIETVKINNSRTIGILLTQDYIFALFYTGNALMKWEYKTELRVKALLSYHISQGILSPWYRPDTPIHALIIGSSMDTAVKLLTSTGGYKNNYFKIDTSFENFYYLPDVPAGEVMIRLLSSPAAFKNLINLLLSDLQPPSSDYGPEHDAWSEGMPVLLAFDFNLVRIARFLTGLSIHQVRGHMICFDFQKDTLLLYCGDAVTITTIDLSKFERRFFPETHQSKI